MNDGIFTRKFWRDAAERATKTAAQALVLVFGAGQLDVWHADWRGAAGVALAAAVLSLVTSLGSSRLGGDSSSASALDTSR